MEFLWTSRRRRVLSRRWLFVVVAGMEECFCFVLFMVFRLDAEHIEKKANIGCLTIKRRYKRFFSKSDIFQPMETSIETLLQKTFIEFIKYIFTLWCVLLYISNLRSFDWFSVQWRCSQMYIVKITTEKIPIYDVPPNKKYCIVYAYLFTFILYHFELANKTSSKRHQVWSKLRNLRSKSK